MKITLATVAAAFLALLAGAAFAAPSAIPAQPSQIASAPTANADAAIANASVPVDASAATAGAATAEAPAEPPSASPAGASKVRIVRLSQVRGAVQLDRNAGQGFEGAFANLPIVEGAKLRTDDGFAEVEFEDNSTLRLTPGTLVEFPRLEALPSGAKLTTVRVVKGMAYITLAGTKGNEFAVTFGDREVFPMPSSHLRLRVGSTKARLAVMAGSVELAEKAGETAEGAEVDKKKTATFTLADERAPEIAKGVAKNENDQWDKTSLEYQQRYANSSAFASSPYSYGISDLNYYGAFSDFGDCGSMWQPYFVNAAWSPFANGFWAWYPTGYSWVSPYPWGWMPFHFGAWSYCSGFGWGWRPGGSWLGLGNDGIVTSNAGAPFVPTRPPGHRPLPGRGGLVPVNLKPLAISGVRGQNTFVFRRNSAGLGVPRGDLGSLHSLSKGVERHGLVAEPVFAQPIQTGRYGAREGNAAVGRDGYSTVRRAPSAGYNGSSGSIGARPGGGDEGAPRGGGNAGGGGAGGGGMSHGGGAPSGGASGGGGHGR